MLEVNDFNAVRISLASPEQIRSWSYGEVTKPETLNYRTMKPEKDGLFCEKIFGPTKDFECFCGKYKRIRYKGIICDKCGVEVARSKVRRERMGHIELATPVSHVWFVKGTPSRLGLLLDISPRSLERVLYFAQYIVTEVNEKARAQAVEDIRADALREMEHIEQSINQRIEAIKQGLKEALGRLEAEGDSHEDVMADELRQRAAEEIDQLDRSLAEAKAQIQQEAETKVRKLEDLCPTKLLNEGEYHELKGRWGNVFQAGMGAEAIRNLVSRIDIGSLWNELRREIFSSSGQRRKKAAKRLRVVGSLRKSGNRPEWMLLTVLPVLPPDLRPMVQLDGGRFATSDLNDLYRRVINRNNRLKRLLELGAPEIIIRNEKRMLQEAVDSLIDNSRRGRPMAGSFKHTLKSLSDMLKGKQGRFRQNLLGKRVDYSGRSVIVVGPELKLHQCGLPKRMALELFKPFVMRRLVERGYAHNIKSAKRIVERVKPEVWDVLEEVIADRPVLLNRAPTLHRLGIQAFQPVLIEGSAIQIHPLVCAAFNADFDGDQMAVHIPLSEEAVKEAKYVMLSVHNMLSPSSGEPTIAPTLDMVLGCYYLTILRPGAKGEGKLFGNFGEARLAYDMGHLDLQAEIEVRVPSSDGRTERLKTSVGRIIFNEVLPPELRFCNKVADRKELRQIVAECLRRFGTEKTALILDDIKRLGFHYATKSGITIAIGDISIPEEKASILKEADERIAEMEAQFRRGLITESERYNSAVETWSETTDRLSDAIQGALDHFGSLYMMSTSGTKGNIAQIRQMGAMRGLMTDPSGRIIDLPIRSSFREGLTVLEYFISTHGARKGLADTALRTADSGYLTRRLIDVAQDVVVLEEDCGTSVGITLVDTPESSLLESFLERIVGRIAASAIVHPQTGGVIVDRNEEIDEGKAQTIVDAHIARVHVRSPLSCDARRGVCQMCYGRDLARGRLVGKGEAVGIIAAQSIGEPGTQLTMRTFHTGGVAGVDITSGLPRVEELFEARVPKGQAVVSEIDGVVEITRTDDLQRIIRVVSSEVFRDEYPIPAEWKVLVAAGEQVDVGRDLALAPTSTEAFFASDSEALVGTPQTIQARIGGKVASENGYVVLYYEAKEEREYVIPPTARILVENGVRVRAGEQLTEGSINPQDMLRILGPEAVQLYLVQEVQKVYRSQGVSTNDKHIEIIVRQMLRRVRVSSPGDTELLPGELIDRFVYQDVIARVLAEGGEPATAEPVLLGVTKASLNTYSFLAAASFQETTRVLTQAALEGATDRLLGLKENVIIGKLIPARSGIVKALEGKEEAAMLALDRATIA